MMSMMKFERILTRYMGAGGELGRHLRIHGDHYFTFVSHELVPLLNLFMDPVLERLADHSGTDVDYPLLWNVFKVWVIGQVVLDLRLVGDEG